jgi:hypothetical protein
MADKDVVLEWGHVVILLIADAFRIRPGARNAKFPQLPSAPRPASAKIRA